MVCRYTADRGKCQGLQCSVRSGVCVYTYLYSLQARACVKNRSDFSGTWRAYCRRRRQMRMRNRFGARRLGEPAPAAVPLRIITISVFQDAHNDELPRPSVCCSSIYNILIWTVNTMRTYALLWPLAAFLVTRTSGSAIPMWEFLSRGEKVTFGN